MLQNKPKVGIFGITGCMGCQLSFLYQENILESINKIDLVSFPQIEEKFILIEMEDDIAKKITAERIKREIAKYDYKDGFEYCELDKPLFDENGQIEETCDFNQFATYIYFTETQTNIDKKRLKALEALSKQGQKLNMGY